MVRKNDALRKLFAGLRGQVVFLRHVLGLLEILENKVRDLDPSYDFTERIDCDPSTGRASLGSDFGLDEAHQWIQDAALMLDDDERAALIAARGDAFGHGIALSDWLDDGAAELLSIAKDALVDAFEKLMDRASERIKANGDSETEAAP